MKGRDIARYYQDGRMSRRDFTKAAAALGVGFATVPVGRRAMAAEGTPMYFGWAGYEDPAFISSYLAKHETPPEYQFWGSEDEAFQKMRQGFPVDISAPCTYSLGRWYDGGLLKPIDNSRL